MRDPYKPYTTEEILEIFQDSARRRRERERREFWCGLWQSFVNGLLLRPFKARR